MPQKMLQKMHGSELCAVCWEEKRDAMISWVGVGVDRTAEKGIEQIAMCAALVGTKEPKSDQHGLLRPGVGYKSTRQVLKGIGILFGRAKNCAKTRGCVQRRWACRKGTQNGPWKCLRVLARSKKSGTEI